MLSALLFFVSIEDSPCHARDLQLANLSQLDDSLFRLLDQLPLVAAVPRVILNEVTSTNLFAHSWSWAIGSSVSAALMSFDTWSLAVGKPGLSCRSRNWGFAKTADHPQRERLGGQGLV